MQINPLNAADSYKVGHYFMYPKNMEYLQSNFTPRSCRIEGRRTVVFFGLQAFLMKLTNWFWPFFNDPLAARSMIEDHKKRVEELLGQPYDVSHLEALQRLGFLPLRFSALPEGTRVPLRVPMFIIENTRPGFGWLVNYIESVMSAEIWHPITSATIADEYRGILSRFAEETGDPGFVDWQAHDFSFRGMSGSIGGAAAGAGHLLSFAGSDTILAMDWAQQYYFATKFVGGSVPATEHSVMCAGGELNEMETFQRLLRAYPKGIISIVSDTWDLWHVLTKILPALKDEIMARDGKLVIRPDSGDPEEILCGISHASRSFEEQEGVIRLLHRVFPGPKNEKGYDTLDPHVGVIYGDSITIDRAKSILTNLKLKRFASTTPVFGVGSFTYQYVTRDTCGLAMKATWAKVGGESRDLFKDPVTDTGMKKSAKGRLAVFQRPGSTMAFDSGELYLVQQADQETEEKSLLKPVWEDGNFRKVWTFREIAQRLGNRLILPG